MKPFDLKKSLIFNSVVVPVFVQTFVLLRHKNEQIGVQKILKKFPVEPNIKSGKSTKTNPGATGILVNGVEIINYKSDDKIFKTFYRS